MRFSHHFRHHGHGCAPHFGSRGGWHRGLHRGWFEGEGPGEGRGPRRRRVFDSNELRLVLLKLIADQPRHGYELIRAIEDLTGGAYVPSAGFIYPTLTLLQDMEQIEEAAAETSGARKPFAATDKGRAELEQKKEEVEALFARLGALASGRERTDAGPVRRAMVNLRVALIERVRREGVSEETLYAVADILDEAARQIERLKTEH